MSDLNVSAKACGSGATQKGGRDCFNGKPKGNPSSLRQTLQPIFVLARPELFEGA